MTLPAGHEPFVRAILAAPEDPAPRLLYADWLEEQSGAKNLARAEYLRLDCQFDGLAEGSPQQRNAAARLQVLERKVGDEWWRLLDASPIGNCVDFAFECPQRWDTLQPTDDPAVRHCPQCALSVYYCRNAGEARRHGRKGHCIAVDTRAVRFSGDLNAPGNRLGIVSAEPRRRVPLADRKPIDGTSEAG